MQRLNPRRWAVGGGLMVMATLCWFAPPWAQGDSESDPAPETAQLAASPQVDDSAAAPAAGLETVALADAPPMPEPVALADGQSAPEASPIGGEQKILTAATRPDSAEGGAQSPGGGGAWRPSRGLRGAESFSPAEWDNVAAFMAKYSPIRDSVIEALPESQRRNKMRAAAVADYLAYQRSAGDPPMAAMVLSRVKLQDDIFDLARQLRQAPPPAQTALKNRLHQKVSDLVDENIKERQLWLDRLKANLATQQAALNHESTQRDEIIEQRFADILRSRFTFPPSAHRTGSSSPGNSSHNAGEPSTTRPATQP